MNAWLLRKSWRLVCALWSETCLALFSHAALPCGVTWHVWSCVMSRCGRVHMAYDSRFAWGVLASHSSFSTSLCLPLSPSFPPSSFFLSNYRLSPLSLSSWSYLLFHSPAKQLPLPDSAPLRTAWLASFLSTIKVRDGQGFHGHFTTVAWTWAKSNLRVKPEHSSHFISLLLSYSIQIRYVNGKWLKGLFSVVKNYASNHAISSLFPAPH